MAGEARYAVEGMPLCTWGTGEDASNEAHPPRATRQRTIVLAGSGGGVEQVDGRTRLAEYVCQIVSARAQMEGIDGSYLASAGA